MYVCWLATLWPVTAPLSPSRARLTARFCCGAMLPGSGSLATSAPTGIVTEPLPPKVTARFDPATTSAPCAWTPTRTLSNVTGSLPKALERVIRRFWPPTLVWTMLRIVWSANVAGVVSALAPQVATVSVAGPAAAG
jgi:hypothetical protein